MTYYLSALMAKIVYVLRAIPVEPGTVEIEPSWVKPPNPMNLLPGPENTFGLEIGKPGF